MFDIINDYRTAIPRSIYSIRYSEYNTKICSITVCYKKSDTGNLMCLQCVLQESNFDAIKNKQNGEVINNLLHVLISDIIWKRVIFPRDIIFLLVFRAIWS